MAAEGNKFCPFKHDVAVWQVKVCDKDACAWWDADKERCAVLSIARNK